MCGCLVFVRIGLCCCGFVCMCGCRLCLVLFRGWFGVVVVLCF